MEQLSSFHVRLFHIEVVSTVCQFEDLDALLQVGSVSSVVGMNLPFELFLSCFVLGVDVYPHLFINLAIEFVLIRLAHAATDFTEFSCAIVHRLFMELDFIFLACFEGSDNPLQGLVINVNGFDSVSKLICQDLFSHIRLRTFPFESRTAVVDIALTAFLDVWLRSDRTATMPTHDQTRVGKVVFLL